MYRFMHANIHTYILPYLPSRQVSTATSALSSILHSTVVLDTSLNSPMPYIRVRILYSTHLRHTRQVSTAMSTLSWMAVEWYFKKRPSVLGIISGIPFCSRARLLSLSLSLSLSRARALLAIPASAFSKLSRPAAFHTKFTTRLTFENVSKVP